MKTVLKRFWMGYSILGAIWLTFTIGSMIIFRPFNSTNVSTGRIIDLKEATWGNITEVYALIETEDKKGTVWTKIYDPGRKLGDRVEIEISADESDYSYIHSHIIKPLGVQAEPVE
jgi:hypothetical protein